MRRPQQPRSRAAAEIWRDHPDSAFRQSCRRFLRAACRLQDEPIAVVIGSPSHDFPERLKSGPKLHVGDREQHVAATLFSDFVDASAAVEQPPTPPDFMENIVSGVGYGQISAALGLARDRKESGISWSTFLDKQPKNAERAQAWLELCAVRRRFGVEDSSATNGGVSKKALGPPGIRKPTRDPVAA